MVKAYSLVISVDFFLIPKMEFLDLQGLSEFQKSEFIVLLENHFKAAWKYFQNPLKFKLCQLPSSVYYNT